MGKWTASTGARVHPAPAPLVDAVVLRYTWAERCPRIQHEGCGRCPGRLDLFHITKEPPSCVAGAPTALGPRVSRGALRTAAGDALRRICWSWPTTTARRPVHVWIERRTSPRPPPATRGARQAPSKVLWH